MVQELTGKEDEAFTLLNKTGKKSYRPKSEIDTWKPAPPKPHPPTRAKCTRCFDIRRMVAKSRVL